LLLQRISSIATADYPGLTPPHRALLSRELRAFFNTATNRKHTHRHFPPPLGMRFEPWVSHYDHPNHWTTVIGVPSTPHTGNPNAFTGAHSCGGSSCHGDAASWTAACWRSASASGLVCCATSAASLRCCATALRSRPYATRRSARPRSAKPPAAVQFQRCLVPIYPCGGCCSGGVGGGVAPGPAVAPPPTIPRFPSCSVSAPPTPIPTPFFSPKSSACSAPTP
jgi:hypothetical protein